MKKIKIGINGFGRIGRAIYRINQKRKIFDVVAINDINPDIKNIAYLLQYDSTYGKLDSTVRTNDDDLLIDSNRIKVYHERSIVDVPWDNHNVDIVIESSGLKENLYNILSADDRDEQYLCTYALKADLVDHENTKTIVMGVNDGEYDPNKHKIVSSSICDTIALLPILKVISDMSKIESGYLTTLHPWLSYQNLLDGPSVSWSQPGDIYSHYSLGRASTENLIPKSTSAHIAADHVFPGTSDVIHGFSFRVPTTIVSGAVLNLVLDDVVDLDELKGKFQEFEDAQSHRVIKNSMEPLTSIDYSGTEYSAIIDQRWTKIEQENHVNLVYWYDNEWGYSSKVVDVIEEIIRKKFLNEK